MHPGVIVKRKATANQRSVAAVKRLVKKFKLSFDPASLTPSGRDPQVLEMIVAERTAELLEALAEKAAPVKGPVPEGGE